jgi:hypothetical protein
MGLVLTRAFGKSSCRAAVSKIATEIQRQPSDHVEDKLAKRL